MADPSAALLRTHSQERLAVAGPKSGLAAAWSDWSRFNAWRVTAWAGVMVGALREAGEGGEAGGGGGGGGGSGGGGGNGGVNMQMHCLDEEHKPVLLPPKR